MALGCCWWISGCRPSGGGPTTTTTSGPTKGSGTDALNKLLLQEGKALTQSSKDYQSKYGKDLADEKTAYGGIRQNAGIAESYMPQQQALISLLYGGGNLGEGMDALRQSWQQAQGVYQPYLQSNYLDPMTNPYLQPAIEAHLAYAKKIAEKAHASR